MSQVPTHLQHVLSVLSDSIFEAIFTQAGIECIEDLWLCNLTDLKDTAVIVTGEEAAVTSLTNVQYGKVLRLFEWFDEQQATTMDVWYNLTPNDFKKTYFKPKSTNVTINNNPTISTGILPGVQRSLSDYLESKRLSTSASSSASPSSLILFEQEPLNEFFDLGWLEYNFSFEK